MRWLLLALVVAGCGGTSSNSDGGHDLSMGAHPDLTSTPPDQSVLADLAMESPDLAMPDLVTLPDMTKVAVKDLAGTDGGIMCPASMGYAGQNVCGEVGMCNGHKYAVDCDGNNCTCSIDGNALNVFPQGNACNNVDNVYMLQCGF
jgi:hypothetical protein